MSWLAGAVDALTALSPALSQNVTNGLAWYGTLQAPTLPQYLDTLPGSWEYTNPAGTSVPDTGSTRIYDWVVARAIKAPDGYNKSVILINGQFPGPLIEANWGDTIQVTVRNEIEDTAEGLTLHWHGQPQRLSPGEDGVPAVSQCPIPPGSNLTYSFRAESFGTGWYHSHVSGQYTDGLYGPMVIYGPTQASYDVDIGPIMLSDYSHESYYQILQGGYRVPPVFPNVDNNLINGKGIFDCSAGDASNCTPYAGLAKFKFQRNKIHRLRLINTGGEGTQKFTIDNHTFNVIANDYVPVQPYETDVVTLGIGQRTDILVNGTDSMTGAYWMRSDLDIECLNLTATNSHALAAIYYPGANTSEVPRTTATPWLSNDCNNDALSKTIPYYPQVPPPAPATTAIINITVSANATGSFIFFVNGSSFEGDYNDPLLPLAEAANLTGIPAARNLYDFGSNSSIRIIIENYWPTEHPMHLHGHDFWILATGLGRWDENVTNPSNPQRRDTQLLAPAAPDGTPSYLVIEFMADNPGVWPLHCHTTIHVSAGLLINVLERPDLLATQKSPDPIQQTCASWVAWSKGNYVDQIDSGL